MDIALLQVLTRHQLKALLRGIHSAFDEHVRYACACQGSLLGCKSVDKVLMEEQSHLKCKFGRWYSGDLPKDLCASEDFRLLGDLHQRFHEAARNAMVKRELGVVLTAEDCERLLTAQSDLLLAMNQYLREVAEGNQLFDPLTGLMNRQEMTRLLSREKAHSERTGSSVMLAMADLDHFKEINDTYGHEAGDIVLRETAVRFSSGLRLYDLLFRFGGEEFLFCLPDADLPEAKRICERIRQSVEGNAIDIGDGRVAKVTVSFGLAPLGWTCEVSEAIRMADKALYTAKEKGRNRLCALDRFS